jgi:hypothetical protein
VAISGCGSTACSSCGTTEAVARHVVVGDHGNGETISLHTGDTVTVILSSSYWKVSGSSAPKVLRQDGSAVLLPRPRTCPDIPGLGCTPLKVLFTAVGPGTAVVKASRSVCGEALRCVGRSTRFTLSVVVGG